MIAQPAEGWRLLDSRMILVRPLAANDNRQLHRALVALVAAVVGLFGLVVAVILLGTSPMPAPVAQDSKLADTPACKAALARARASQALRSQEAVAAATAMLRACKPARGAGVEPF